MPEEPLNDIERMLLHRRRGLRPPRLAEALLRCVLAPTTRDFILGDLAEQHARRVGLIGRVAAARWYWRQLLPSVRPSLQRRFFGRAAARRAASPGLYRTALPPIEKGAAMLRNFLQDSRLAVRTLRRDRGWTFSAVLTLALAIGATTAIYSVVDGVLVEPLPFEDSGRLYAVDAWEIAGERAQSVSALPTWQALHGAQDVFDDLAGYGLGDQSVMIGEAAERLTGAQVSAGFLATLGVEPALGRGFTSADDVEGAPDVVIISHALWTTRYGADAGVLGKVMRIDYRPHTIVGVLPRDFAFPHRGARYWTPLATAPRAASTFFLDMVGRLRADVSPAQAAARLAALEVTAERPFGGEASYSARMRPLRDEVVGEAGELLLLFLAAVGAVLVVGCINVANLLLSRAVGRDRERTVRAALGASRGRLAQQLLTESIILSLLGAAAGIGVAYLLTHTLLAMSPASLPRQQEIGLNGGVLGFTLLLAFAVGIATGSLPALRGSRVDLGSGIREAGCAKSSGRGLRKLSGGLVVVQVAIAVVLVVVAGLLLRSLAGMLLLDRGFDTGRVLTFDTIASTQRYPDYAARSQLYAEVGEQIAALPGATSVAWAHVAPYGGAWVFGFNVEGAEDDDDSAQAEVVFASPGLFETLQIPLVRGRLFDDTDGGSVVVINETMAATQWPAGDAIGARITLGRYDPVTVVGIVRDTRYRSLTEHRPAQAYLPYAHGFAGDMVGFVRTRGEPLDLAGPLRELVQAHDPEIAVSGVSTLRQRVADEVAEPRFRATLLASFSASALLLAVIGVYGVLAYAVARQTREFGIRKALGADRRRIVVSVLRRGGGLTAAGLALGVLAAHWTTDLLADQLFAIQPSDPVTYAVSVALVAAAAIAACLLPGRRAAAVDPLAALRSE